MNYAQNMNDGTIRIQSTRSDPRLRAMARRLGFWINSQLTDWEAADELARAQMPFEFGHLVPDDDADARDGVRFRMSHCLGDSEDIHHLVRRSSPGERFDDGGISNLENVSAYRGVLARGTMGQVSLFRKLARDPTFSDGEDSVTEGLLSGYWTLDLPTGTSRDPRMRELRDCLQADIGPLLHEQTIREFVVACFEDGYGMWEIVDAINGGVRELSPINANTLDRWIMDPYERELQRVRLNTGRRNYELDARHLMLYSHRRTGANLEGIANVRPPAGYIELKQAFVRLTGFAGESHGMGIKTLEKTNPDLASNNDEGAKVVDIFSALTAEDNPVIELPGGMTFKWHSPQTGQPNFLPVLEWLDQQIAKSATSTGTLVGFQQFGSKALADVKDDEKLRSTLYYGLLLGRTFDRHVIPRIARNKYGYRGPLPTLGFTTQRQVRDPDRHARLVSYVGGGMLTWTRHDEERLRTDEGLPPLDESVEPQPTGQAPDQREVAAAGYNAALAAPAASAAPPPSDLVSLRDAAAAMGVPTNTISLLCKRGELDYWQLGAHRRVSLSDVHALARPAEPIAASALALDGPRYMVALIPPQPFVDRIRDEAVLRGMKLDRDRLLHVTLVSLGHRPIFETSDVLIAQLNESLSSPFASALFDSIGLTHPRMRVSGAGVFLNGHEQVLQLLVGGPGLVELRTGIVSSLSASGLVPYQEHGFIPHLTLAEYEHDDAPPANWIALGGVDYPEWVVDRVHLVRGHDVVAELELEALF